MVLRWNIKCCVQLSRQALRKKSEKIAIIWESDDPNESRKITYNELFKEVCKFSNGLRSLGVQKGDRVTIYLPMIPEAAIAMLSCARIGAIHSVVFGGFAPESLRNRIEDCDSSFVITANEGLRGGKKIPLLSNVKSALKGYKGVKTIVVKRTTSNENFESEKIFGIMNWSKTNRKNVTLKSKMQRIHYLFCIRQVLQESPKVCFIQARVIFFMLH